jgi:hypothetical protein
MDNGQWTMDNGQWTMDTQRDEPCAAWGATSNSNCGLAKGECNIILEIWNATRCGIRTLWAKKCNVAG